MLGLRYQSLIKLYNNITLYHLKRAELCSFVKLQLITQQYFTHSSKTPEESNKSSKFDRQIDNKYPRYIFKP